MSELSVEREKEEFEKIKIGQPAIGRPVTGRPGKVGPVSFSRWRRNVVHSAGLQGRIEATARNILVLYYKRKFKIFWRIALLIHDIREKLKERRRRKAVKYVFNEVKKGLDSERNDRKDV